MALIHHLHKKGEEPSSQAGEKTGEDEGQKIVEADIITHGPCAVGILPDGQKEKNGGSPQSL